ncbi:TetR/AcrR family transcriptional regulator [Allokutzneria sp. A3M-2-11 16]|uniref:TetR/AcrR family transcriptional regulator n=1 Tax=Allokutzneria sp. A3M-2-11 16 TaxID=2962043 RepID=UPI0020B6D80B|nr:TetR/AcrR family transcriptional regulator [Allokutzneria sp. A3M-2-11 16]MCP3803067.1 TetR/AcrR family transcriptional regulator [Allokutzneria sp. A3M-2-11 16]
MVGGANAGGAGAGQAIVAAAFAQIAKKGLEGLRQRQVATTVGLDHSTLHHYFPTKEDLVASVVEHTTAQLWPTVRAEGSTADQVRRHLRLMARALRERSELFVVLCELNLRALRDPAIRVILDRSDQAWREALRERLARGAWPGGDPAAGADLVIAAIKGSVFAPEAAADALGQLERLLENPTA